MNFFNHIFNKIFHLNKIDPVILVPSPDPIVTTPVSNPQVVSGVATPRVEVGTISCQTFDQRLIIYKGFDLLNRVFASPEYKKEFMAFEFEQTNGMSNQQIWDLMVSKAGTKLNVDLHDMGYIRDHFEHTIGLEDARDPETVYMNSYFVGTPFMVMTNGAHEFMHYLKFSHANPTDYKSVPYGQNAVVENTVAVMKFTA